MLNHQIYRELERIRSLASRADLATLDNFELKGHWGRYLCVLAAGFAENSLREIYTDYAKRTSSPATGNYASGELQRVQNPKASRFVQIA
jgi:hypothetical protein